MAASTKSPWEVADFSGGITDNVFTGQTNTYFEGDNFIITPDKKLLSRPGSTVDDPTNSTFPTGNSRIGALINYARNDKLFAQSATAVCYRSGAGTGPWVALVGPSGAYPLSAGTTANYISHDEWNKQLILVNDAFANPVKIYKDGSGVYQVRAVGLPALASSPTITPGTVSTQSFVYAFVYRYDYTVWTQSFQELGPTTWVTITNSSDPSTSANAITSIPVLTNGGGSQYDIAHIFVDIYRTINNGVNFYKVASVVNGTVSYTDNMSDATLQTKPQLYINDGTLDYYPAPSAKFVHVVGNIGLYGYTKDATGEHPYRIAQSVPGNPGFVPQITWVEVEEEVSGLNSVRNMPIVLGKKIIYRLDGTFDAQGRGGLNPVKIHHSAGCISNSSCVEAENWLFWAGNDGFYASDGYNVLKISDHLNTRYQTMLSATPNTQRIQGKFDEINRRVYWTVGQTASNLENDSLFCLDLRYGVTPNSSFTTWSGASFRPTAIELFNSTLYRADNNAFVFKHDPAVLTDPKVDTGKAVTNWDQETIVWTHTTSQFNFGSTFYRKFVSRILLQAANAGNTTIQITAVNDQGKKTRSLKIIRWRRNILWEDPTFVWGNSDCVWDSTGLIEQWRRFPTGGLRVSYLQLTFTNGLGIVAASANDGQCVLNSSSKTVVLSGQWPSQSVGYFLRLANDGYNRSYPVQSINGVLDTLTLLDPGSNLPVNGSYDWELWGYSKGEPLNLLGYNLHWDNVDQSQNTYQSGDDGSNN